MKTAPIFRWPVAGWAAAMPILLPWLGAWLAVLACLVGLFVASGAALATILRRRFPTAVEQRAFLLRGMVYHGREYHFPRVSGAQRLERMRYAGWGFAVFFLIYPSSVITELVCNRLGWLAFDQSLNHTVLLKIRLAVSFFSVVCALTFGAYALAVGWLAGGVLQQTRVESGETSID